MDNDGAIADRIMRFLGLVMAALVIAMIVGLMASHGDGLLGATGVGLAVLLAAFGIGAMLGFLFSVPRVMSQPVGVTKPSAGGAGSMPVGLLQTNTNLERISDWLTTMLVGVALSRIDAINQGMVGFRDFILTYAPDFPALAIVAPLILLFGLIAGFLFMYLYTRIILVQLFRTTEEDNLLPRSAQRAVVRAASDVKVTSFTVARNIAADRSVTVTDALDVMFQLLYDTNGYLRVIQLAAQLADTPVSEKASYWFYLAAAFGQQRNAAVLKLDDALSLSARDNALDSSRRAVRIDPSYRDRLWSIADPAGPDDDLSSLRDDPDFLKLVGRA